jgi:PBSX family phage terminase large subunit
MYTNEVRISDVIAKVFHPVHLDIKKQGHSEYWLKGGRGSTKSSFISFEIVHLMTKDPLANAIIYRKVAETMRDTVYAQMIWAIDMLGLTAYFRYRVSPLEIVYELTGQRILFKGADDPRKSKSIKLSKGYFKCLWFEETTEFDGMDDIRTIKESVIRTVDQAFTFYSYNPPQSANNWTNAEALIPAKGRLVHHSDYTQVPPEWLGKAFIADAEALRDANEKAYRHTYLGEVTGTGGQVFDNLEIRKIPDEELNVFDRFMHGHDFGFAGDPDAYVKAYYNKKLRKLYIVDEFYGIRVPLNRLAEEIHNRAGNGIVTCDSADPRMIAELRRLGVQAMPAKKGAGSIEHGMRWLQDLSAIVIDPSRCPNAAREFSTYEYRQDRFSNFLADYPDKNNHTIDSTRYCVESESTARYATTFNLKGL